MKQGKQPVRRWARNACLGIAGVLCLAACAHAPEQAVLTKIQVERVQVPVSLLTVEAMPAAPVSRMQSAAADYIVRLKINDDECHSDVVAIAATQQ